MHLSFLRPGILIELLDKDMGQWSKWLVCRDPDVFHTSVGHTLLFRKQTKLFAAVTLSYDVKQWRNYNGVGINGTKWVIWVSC